MQAPAYQDEIAALGECGPLRAWSLIVTVLGDLCQSPRDRIAGRALMRVMAAMGISDQTVRVALHRLRRDGWIVSERRGRDAVYGLSPTGWAETQVARSRVYEADPPSAGPLLLLIAPPGMAAADFGTLLPADAAQITPRTALVADKAPPAEGIWALPIDPVKGGMPQWATEAVVDLELTEGYIRLARAAGAVCGLAPPADPVTAAALRLLALHHWRRLRLRHGALPDLLLGRDWPGAAARAAVMEVLRRYPRPCPAALSG